MDAIRKDAVRINNEFGIMTAAFQSHQTEADAEISSIDERVTVIENWKKTALSKAVIGAIVAAVGVIQFGFLGFDWVVDYISKLLQSAPK